MLKVVPDAGPCGARLITTDLIASGEAFLRIEDYRLRSDPTYQTIQISSQQHIEQLGALAYMNHSCKPNVIIQTGELVCYAAREICAGEELTFFYPSTEWEMARPFMCQCGAAECIRLVVGSRYLPLDVLSRYFINQHILDLVLQCLRSQQPGLRTVTAPK